MSSAEDPVDDARAIAEGLRYAGLDPAQEGYVRAYLRQPRSEWFFCCGSACDPCVLTIARAVDRARELLGLPVEK
jgi:hypothetical protein